MPEFSVLVQATIPPRAGPPLLWQPPATGLIKLSFDAAYSSRTHTPVSGVLARNEIGRIMGAGIFPHSMVADPFVAEARACDCAVRLALDLGFRCVVFEGDSLTVIRKLCRGEEDRSLLAPIIGDIRAALGVFMTASFRHVFREANGASHTLSHSARQLSEPLIWIEEAPEVVDQVVQSDWVAWLSSL